VNYNKIINNLKSSNETLEKKLSEKLKNEEKLNKEIESLNRSIKLYKEKLQIELTERKIDRKKSHNKKNLQLLLL